METAVRSVTEYIDKCLSNPSLQKTDTRIFYRGVHRIFRESPHKPSIYYTDERIKNEDRIFKEALSFLPELLAWKTTVEKLIVMQHYRFPTRIMDISGNPLTALFFACFADRSAESAGKDGMVYLYTVPDGKIKYCDSDAVSVIANLCKRPADFSIRDICNLDRDEFNKEEPILYLIHEICEEKPYFHPLVDKDDINSVVCLRPRMNNPRIIRQDGHFFLFGIDRDKTNPAKLKPEWIDQRRFLIPAEAKKKILRELEALNIHEAFVYPDFEHISSHVVGKYGGRA